MTETIFTMLCLKQLESKCWQVAEKLQEKEFYIRVNSISDPTDDVANDVKYHRRCWVYAQREAEGSDDNDDIQVTSRVISNIELINMIRSELIDHSF